MSDWISVKERMPKPGRKVLINQKTVSGEMIIIGSYQEKFKHEFCGDCHGLDYDEDNDLYYLPEGWYEYSVNSSDYTYYLIDGEVTHWMPLPRTKLGENCEQTTRN